jgi:hypothetical protein
MDAVVVIESGRNHATLSGTKPAIDGCSSTGGRDEICNKHPTLAGRHSTADHPSDRAFRSSRVIARCRQANVLAARSTNPAEKGGVIGNKFAWLDGRTRLMPPH